MITIISQLMSRVIVKWQTKRMWHERVIHLTRFCALYNAVPSACLACIQYDLFFTHDETMILTESPVIHLKSVCFLLRFLFCFVFNCISVFCSCFCCLFYFCYLTFFYYFSFVIRFFCLLFVLSGFYFFFWYMFSLLFLLLLSLLLLYVLLL